MQLLIFSIPDQSELICLVSKFHAHVSRVSVRVGLTFVEQHFKNPSITGCEPSLMYVHVSDVQCGPTLVWNVLLWPTDDLASCLLGPSINQSLFPVKIFASLRNQICVIIVKLFNDEDERDFETGPILWFNPRILILHFLLFCFLSIRSVDVGHLKIRLLSRAQGLVPVVQEWCEADWRRRSCWGPNSLIWTKETKAWSLICHLQLLETTCLLLWWTWQPFVPPVCSPADECVILDLCTYLHLPIRFIPTLNIILSSPIILFHSPCFLCWVALMMVFHQGVARVCWLHP